MQKLVVTAVLALPAMVFAQEAQDDLDLVEMNSVQEAVSAPTPAPVIAKVEEPAPVVEKKEEKKSDFPKFKQSGGISFTPRMEISSYKDSIGVKTEDVKDGKANFNANRRRLMFGWAYKLNVAVNEKLDLGFRLSDPAAEAGIEIGGSGGNLKSMLGVMLPNAYFTWKPADVFNLSGGLVNVSSNTALDLATLIVDKDATKNFANTYFNSLSGLDFIFPVSKSAKIFLTAGIADYTRHNATPYVYINDKDTTILRSGSEGRIILGADLSFAEKKVSLKPAVQILTRGDIPKTKQDTTWAMKDDGTGKVFVSEKTSNTGINSNRAPIIAEGIDAGLKFTDNFALNLGIGAAHDNVDSSYKSLLINFALEPRLNFGGEKGKLFDLRAKYGLYTYNLKDFDGKEYKTAEGVAGGVVHHIDARFGIAVNEKFSIVPRYRLWAANNNSTSSSAWVGIRPEKNGDDSENKKARSLSRLELGFAASF